MPSPVLGLHHVTATVDDAQADLDFAAGLLGLRLVKKTVNFDNRHVFHFYYGDRVGTPGTIWTTFPYKGYGVRPGRHGAGQITATTFSIPRDSVSFWRRRLADGGVEVAALARRFDEDVLICQDPSGLVMELLATEADGRTGWTTPDVDQHSAILGIHSVSATVRALGPTREFLTAVLGFRETGTEGERTRFSVGPGGPGAMIDVVETFSGPGGVNGLGTVHHVALAVGSSADQLAMRERLLGLGVQVTPVLDRQYFQSIYFREPGGVLFEIATTAPGFAVDEDVESLGTALKLPAWEEAHRLDIERGLPAVTLRQSHP